MSKQLGFVLLGLGVVGGAIAISRQAAASKPPQSLPPAEPIEEAEIPEPAIQFPESESPPGEVGPGAGSGPIVLDEHTAEELLLLLPIVIQNVNLTGFEDFSYGGIVRKGPGGIPYYHWTIRNSLGTMPIEVYQSVDDMANNWISFFWHTDPPPSPNGGHAILFKESPTASPEMLEYMRRYIAGLKS